MNIELWHSCHVSRAITSHRTRRSANPSWPTCCPAPCCLARLRRATQHRTKTSTKSASAFGDGTQPGVPSTDPAVPGTTGSPTTSTANGQAESAPPSSSASRATPGQPTPPPRVRQTFEQMQREARAKLGDLVRQQLEVERQAGHPAGRSSPSAGTASASGSSRSSNNNNSDDGGSSSPIDVTAVAVPRVKPTTAPGTAGGTAADPAVSPAAAAAAAISTAAGTASTAATATPPPPPPSPPPAASMAQSPSAAAGAPADGEWADEWQRVKERWRQFVERPLEPPPSHQRAKETHGSLEGGAAGQEDGEIRRRVGVSRLLQLACVAAFAAQWVPVAQALLASGAPAATTTTAAAAATSGKDVVLALLAASPPTPLTLAWQADPVSLAAGNVGCLLTSSLLHSGLVSLMVSLSSLDETLPWLETLDGFMIMLISYGMAALATGLTQLCIGGQVAGIAGLGTAVGMEVAVTLRNWRYTGKPMPPTASCIALMAVAALMAPYQPLVGVWGILGGALGGALSSVLAYDVLYLLRVVLAVSIFGGLAAWNLLTWLPVALWRLAASLGSLVWGAGVAVVQALRRV